MPTPDRDSASLRIVNLLSILDQLADRVTFGAGDSPEWRQSYRWGEGSRPFQDTTFELLNGHAAIEAHLRQQGHHYDAVILSRLSMASRYMQAVRQFAPQAAVVFDTTDLHFLRGYRGAKVTGNINLMKSALLAKIDELSLVRQADCTFVVSPVEKAILEEECPDAQVQIVSNVHKVYGCQRPFSERSGILFIGSFSHHPNVDGMAHFHEEIYPILRAKMPDLKITIIGSHPPDWLKRSSTDNFIVTDYVPDIVPYFNQCKLSIAPLRYGAGVKGKVLLSLSQGVPVVASTTAAEGIPVINGRDILIADSPENFCKSIFKLYSRELLWKKLSANGIEIIDRHFSFVTARMRLIDIFESLGLPFRCKSQSQQNLSQS